MFGKHIFCTSLYSVICRDLLPVRCLYYVFLMESPPYRKFTLGKAPPSPPPIRPQELVVTRPDSTTQKPLHPPSSPFPPPQPPSLHPPPPFQCENKPGEKAPFQPFQRTYKFSFFASMNSCYEGDFQIRFEACLQCSLQTVDHAHGTLGKHVTKVGVVPVSRFPTAESV
jgi:hypothetical protein